MKPWKSQCVPMPLKLAVTEEAEVLFFQVVGNHCALRAWSERCCAWENRGRGAASAQGTKNKAPRGDISWMLRGKG